MCMLNLCRRYKRNHLFLWGTFKEESFMEIKEKFKEASTSARYDPSLKILV